MCSRATVFGIARHLGLSPISAESFAERGMVNDVWHVRTEEGDAIVRLNQDRGPEEARAEYETEIRCYRLLEEAGLPTVEILGVGIFEGRAFLSHRYVEGTPGDKAPDWEATWRTLGEWAARVHRLPAIGEDAQAHWLAQRKLNVDSLGPDDPLLTLGIYREEDVPGLRRRFASLPDGPIGLCHGDLAPRNLIIGPERSTLIDWGCAAMHLVPHHDFEEILRGHLLDDDPNEGEWRAFAEGYGDVAFWVEAEGYLLLKAFDLVRWAIDRCPSRLDELAERARQIHRHLGPQ